MFDFRAHSSVLIGAVTITVTIVIAFLVRPVTAVDDVNVFAAASLRDVLQDIDASFNRDGGTRSRIRFNLAGSNVLAQQIAASSQADIFLSASLRWMDYVENAGRLVPNSRRVFLASRLAVVAHKDSDWSVDEAGDIAALGFRHLALASPDGVPAGEYAKAFLANTRTDNGTLWDRVADRVAPTLDVRAALALVESDPSTLGIVYRTDARASKGVRILFEVPERATPTIQYYAARVQRRDAPQAANDVYAYLFSSEAREIFADHGFSAAARGTATP